MSWRRASACRARREIQGRLAEVESCRSESISVNLNDQTKHVVGPSGVCADAGSIPAASTTKALDIPGLFHFKEMRSLTEVPELGDLFVRSPKVESD